jgi:FkbM family methyltransferase
MKIFLDLGTHKGEGLLEFFQLGIIDGSYEVHTFEACPDLNSLEEIIEKSKNINNFPKSINFYNKAVWISDGIIKFNNRRDHASHIEDTGFSYFQSEEDYNTIDIESIDIAKFIDKLPENSEIVCKMDIEGAEFEVLRHLINTNSINRINKLFVEFHERYTKNESFNTVQELVNIISSKNIEFNLWK